MRILAAIVLLFLVACSSSGDKEEAKPTVEELYNKAMEELQEERYRRAVEAFEDVERTFPYSKWATKAQLMAAYTNYRDEEYDDAVIALERYIKLHPGNEDIAYAYYLKALSYYEQISTVTRDQSFTKLAYDALNDVIIRFGESEYARDAKIKLDLVLDHLAGKEVEVGRFYLKQLKYIAAINRFKVVIDRYQTTSHVPEALYRLVEAYMALGVIVEAKKYAAVLGHNYQGSKWYQNAYYLIEGKPLHEAQENEDTSSWWPDISIPFFDSEQEKIDPPSEDIITPDLAQ